MENEQQQPVVQATPELVPATVDANKMERLNVFGSAKSFECAQRMARALCASTLVPKQYQGNSQEAISNALIALEMASRIGASPLMVMQNLYIVHGNPGWSAKFLIATLNACGKFSPLRYEMTGEPGKDDWGCVAYAIDKATNQTLRGAKVTIGMAKKEGWYDKPGSKWQTMPELMLQYRASAFFQRAYAPEISMGLISAEEAEDIQDAVVIDEPKVKAEIDSTKAKAEDFIKQATAGK